MNIQIYTKFTGIDINGNVIAERKEERANSLVKAFIAWLQCCVLGNTLANIPDTSNTNRTMSSAHWTSYAVGAAGDSNSGILVGTSTTAVAITDYNLTTKITHGTGAGQLSYGAETRPQETHTVSGSTIYFTLRRTFVNTSGSEITINEIGYVARITSSSQYHLMDRTLPTPYAVANNAGVIIDYKWQISV